MGESLSLLCPILLSLLGLKHRMAAREGLGQHGINVPSMPITFIIFVQGHKAIRCRLASRTNESGYKARAASLYTKQPSGNFHKHGGKQQATSLSRKGSLKRVSEEGTREGEGNEEEDSRGDRPRDSQRQKPPTRAAHLQGHLTGEGSPGQDWK